MIVSATANFRLLGFQRAYAFVHYFDLIFVTLLHRSIILVAHALRARIAVKVYSAGYYPVTGAGYLVSGYPYVCGYIRVVRYLKRAVALLLNGEIEYDAAVGIGTAML